MAIKTKKISELASLSLGSDDIIGGSVNLLGTTSDGVTGKLSTKTLFDTIQSKVLEECANKFAPK